MSSKISRILGRVRQQAHLITVGHIFNAPWKSRESRRKQRYRATRESALLYLHRYAPVIRNLQVPEVDKNTEPERAFTIWFQGEASAPPLVKACFRSMRRNLKQELVVLDEKTIFDWITLPDYIVKKWKEGKISHAHFSDICRVELLFRHGGLWFDATDYVTAPVPQYIMDEDVFLFSSGNKIRGSYAFVQNCFIRARKGNPLLGIWQGAIFNYWKEENSKVNYFVHHLLLLLATQENEIAAAAISVMPKIEQDPTHTLWDSHCIDKYDKANFEHLTKDSFFQKTNFKDSRIATAGSDSVASYIINS